MLYRKRIHYRIHLLTARWVTALAGTHMAQTQVAMDNMSMMIFISSASFSLGFLNDRLMQKPTMIRSLLSAALYGTALTFALNLFR